MGASSGIGLKVAEAFASRGVKVGLAARRTEPLAALKQRYPEFVEYASIDVNDPAAPDRLGHLIADLGGMDIYFHVSGIGAENLTLDPAREADIITTNAAGFARMVATAYRYFRDNRRRGRIAAVTSVASTNGIGRLAAYSASKRCARTYLVALRQLANAEHADVSITDIRPGWIRTPLLVDDRRYPMEMSLDYAMPLIVKAIVRHPPVAYIDWRWQAVASLWSRIPNSVWTRINIPISSADPAFPAPAKDPFPRPARERHYTQEDL